MNPAIITREDARLSGQLRYFTGKPCKHGHHAQRYVTTGGCVDCAARFSKAQNGKGEAVRPFGTVEFPLQYVHPDDAAQLYAFLDAQNAARGYPPARRPERTLDGLTPWEIMLSVELRKAPHHRPSLAYLLQAAQNLGIPETYSADNSRPVDDWTPTPEQIAAMRERSLGRAVDKNIGKRSQ